jgi:hypothetical protein
MSRLTKANELRHRIPFWWWITYDAIVGVILALSVRGPALYVGIVVLAIAVVIDLTEAIVKSPWGRRHT